MFLRLEEVKTAALGSPDRLVLAPLPFPQSCPFKVKPDFPKLCLLGLLAAYFSRVSGWGPVPQLFLSPLFHPLLSPLQGSDRLAEASSAGCALAEGAAISLACNSTPQHFTHEMNPHTAGFSKEISRNEKSVSEYTQLCTPYVYVHGYKQTRICCMHVCMPITFPRMLI